MDFSVVPLPISFPELYHHYVPLDAVFFLTIYDDWGRKKLQYFQSLNLRTCILRDVSPEEKDLSGKEIRHLMQSGEAWEHLVPTLVADFLTRWEIPARLRKIKLNEDP